MRYLHASLAALVLLGPVGCTASRELVSALDPTPSVAKTPRISKIVCLWEEGVGKVPNGPTRGVLGQILFLDATGDSTTKVDGQLTIYMFDNRGTIEEQTKPIRKLTLSAEDLAATYLETSVGHSYNVPVAYPRKDRLAVTCTMRVKYVAPTGEVAYSDLASVYLDGRRPKKSETKSDRSADDIAKQLMRDVHPQNSLVKKVGQTEIRETEASENSLKSLTIRQKSSRRLGQSGRNSEASANRFRSSNVTKDALRDVATAADFAPFE